MKKIIPYTLMGLALLLTACDKKIESVTKSQTVSTVSPKTTVLERKYLPSSKPKVIMTSSPIVLTDEEEIEKFQRELAEQYKAEMGEEAFNNSYRGKMFNKDPRVTLTIEDHDPVIQTKIREQLEFIKTHGYAELPQDEMDDLYNTKSELYSLGDASDSAKFELSKLPEDLASRYNGYTRESIAPGSNADVKTGVIRRVFNHNGSTLLLQEESAKNGSNHFTKDFVNEKIGDYPGSFTIYKSKDNKVAYELVWNTDSYRYSMYMIGDKPSEVQRNELRRLALDITNLNAK